MKTLTTILFILLAAGVVMIAAGAKSSAALLQEGIYAEETEGDLDAAMKIYQKIIEDNSASRSNVAQAMYRLGMCNMKKQNEAEAREIFEKVLTQYSDQHDIVDKVQVMMDEIGGPDLASLMPADTKMYIELGSPGRQIEMILNMLKGTPFSNPLAMIGGNGNMPSIDIVAALLNPSMMAEFKKIRGSAIGITGLSQNNNPPMIAVLYPGKSDALRGILIAALNMVGAPAESIEDMQMVNIQNFAKVAYDDKVIIYSQPAGQLDWVIKQYKGIKKEPSLASSNKSFAKISRKQRQNNVLTVWTKVDEIYNGALKLFPEGQVPKELLMANAFVDFSNIEETIDSVSIVQDGLVLRSNVNFKEGHSCLVYDMIRTPSINRDALKAIPSDAVALVSFGLSAPDDRKVDTVRAKIKNITGLDIGREIFANIEQVTLFAASQKQPNPFFPANMGIAITSHSPSQTRRILATILGTINVQFGGASRGVLDMSANRYQVGMMQGNPLHCYIEQTGNATVLSINPDVAKASLAAVKNGSNVCNEGRLANYLNNLSGDTSKLVLVNAGGALKLVYPAILESMKLEQQQHDELVSNFEQLASAAEKMTVEVLTSEQLNEFAMSTSITGMPPLSEVLGPVTKIGAIVEKAKSEARAVKLREAAPSTIAPAAKPPVIDGNEDEVWSAAREYKLGNVMFSPLSSPNDILASYKAMWDKDNLYVLIDVTDDVLINDSGADEWWFDDSAEIYIDADNSKSKQYDSYDGQYHFDWDKTSPSMGVHNNHGNTESVEYALVTTEKGYRVEVKLPWATIGGKPSAGSVIGFDVHVNDDDDGIARDTKISWKDSHDRAWDNPQTFGNAALAGLIGWWKFNETDGTIAADSSGNKHDGTVIGGTKWTQGKFGGAIELNGSDAYVKIDDKKTFNMGDEVTIACWTKVRSTPHEWAGIVTKGDTSWRLSMLEDQRRFHASTGDWQTSKVDGTIEIPANEWHHIAAVYDGKKMCLYLDGKVDACQNFKGGIGRNNFDVLIGENAEKTGRFFSGAIDDVKIYNCALSAEEIKDLYEGR